MLYSKVKEIKEQVQAMGCENWREVIEKLGAGFDDFEVEGFRFIAQDQIDAIMTDEMGWDKGIIGGFNASVLSSVLECPYAAVEELQKSDKYEVLGAWIVSSGKLEELQEEYARLDGYGNHFAHYDRQQHDVTLNNIDFHAFKVN